MTATPPIDEKDREAWRAWREAARAPAVDAAIVTLYADLDARITERSPTCWTSGRCCNFDAYGHRLYVTALEIAWVLERVGPTTQPPKAQMLPVLPSTSGGAGSGACVYQVEKLCSIHKVRPLGCRVFFCQKGTQEWQHELYESFLSRLRELHDSHAVAYRYLEWRAGLAEARGSLLADSASP